MKTKDVETDVGSTDLASYILAVTEQLKRERKFAAAHGYVSALHSFQDFAGGRGIPLPMDEVFTPMRLKAYEEWLMQKKKRPLKVNSVTSYMSSLRAVYNRWMPVGTRDTTHSCLPAYIHGWCLKPNVHCVDGRWKSC